MPWYADLELERHGAHYIEPELNVALLTRMAACWDGGPISSARCGRSSNSAARTPRRCADGSTNSCPSCENILAWEARVAAAAAGRAAQTARSAARPDGACSRSARCRRSNSCSRSSSIRPCGPACCSSTGCARSICACAVLAITSPPCSRAPPRRRCRAAAPRRLRARWRRRCARRGGEFRLMTEPRRIVVEGGRAIGVETTDGEFIRARHFVVSSLNPHQTFLDLLDRCARARRNPRPCQGFQYNLLAPLFALHLNLREPPRIYGERQTSRSWRTP